MKIKKINYFIILLILLTCLIGVVSATEDTSTDNQDITTLQSVNIDNQEVTHTTDTTNTKKQQETHTTDTTNTKKQEANKPKENILTSTPDEIHTSNSENSFKNLSDDLNTTSDIWEVTKDYKFNNETDSEIDLIIDKDNFVINGNNHIIDGNNQSSIFTISGTNVTINNLIFRNANGYRGSVFYIHPGASITTNNVTFINNNADDMGIIFVVGSNYTSNYDKIIDSVGIKGVITTYHAVLNVTNALMTSTKELTNGFINSIEKSAIFVLNSTFANTTSKYTTAIKGDLKTIIKNSRFINLYSTISAGAIGIKEYIESEIDNCTFINVNSEKNGGAILIDNSGQSASYYPIVINNSQFIDCISGFGGAIVNFAGTIFIDNCNFTNNIAYFDGGAIYTSGTIVNITNSKFNKNELVYNGGRGSFGGAIYFDNGILTLSNCNLTNNIAQYGGAILLYDAEYYIKNSIFNNNTDLNGTYNDIESVFTQNYELENNTYSSNNSLDLNEINYATYISAKGMILNLINNTLDVSSMPKKFDLRDWGWVTPVRNQGTMGACWAFGTSGAIESAILRYLGIEMDISENNMQDLSLVYNIYGTIGMVEGGTDFGGSDYALSWFGIISSEYDTYDELGKVSPLIATDDCIHFQDIIYIPPRKNATDNDLIKEALLKYGALSVSYNAEQTPPYFNPETNAQYYNSTPKTNHMVTLVGWDDNYSKDNFAISAPDNGAWIVKNSWGTNWGNDGYFYVSYYDTSFSTTTRSIAYLLNNTLPYTKNYQNDIGGLLYYNTSGNEYKNVYEALDDDLIAGVGTYFNDTNVKYDIEIYVNDELKLKQNGTSPFAGFHTIQLDSFIAIKKGDKFSVKIIQNSIPTLVYSRQHYQNGTSFAKYEGKWDDLSTSNMTASIKVYTLEDKSQIQTSDIVMDYDDGTYFKANITNWDGKTANAGETVTFKINNKTYTAKTNAQGIAQIKITEKPGTYKITTIYLGSTKENNITINDKSKIEGTNLVMDYNDGSYFKVTVYGENGKTIESGKTVTFKINSKTYTAKTNAQGIAQIKITENPKKYTITVSYLGKTLKKTITVKQVLKSSSKTVKRSAKKLILKATLKTSSGKAITSKTIKFIFKGKTYTAKTNTKGTAKVTIKRNVIKKLKKGKKYSVKITYIKDIVKTTVKVK